MMSFGAPVVDNRGVIQEFPALSMVTGLLANALGFHHREVERLEELQQRLEYAVRRDRAGERMQDFQTVDLGQDFMRESRTWTTHGPAQGRGKSSASSGTHIRYRDFLADASYSLSVGLRGSGQVDVDTLENALQHPARPLFIGRKCCAPANRLLQARVQADSALDALRRYPSGDVEIGNLVRFWWEAESGPREANGSISVRSVTDRRDWRNQIHVGERWIASALMPVTMEESDD
jgi:CRISPR system Cascade subunit CasD